ncbi:Iron-sulfur assembly protein 1 [Cymbomonas tetramitiformis]|uniref:Iron-sulfur assembly protein 1 n=1 Tax=Cymbomonas tetramitiformis TaxID=36881 RepID=A0AAE0BMS0_9CHLO|nr:Iron-sulfur assembly protein 1 [Cymbomonas tetramitiformis]
MAASKCSTNLLTSSSLKLDRDIFTRSLRLPCAQSKLVNNDGPKFQILFPSRAPSVVRDRCRTKVYASSDSQIQQQSTVRPSSVPLDGRQSVVVPAAEKISGIPGMFGTPEAGAPAPLGASLTENGVNFAVFSSTAVSISLCLFTEEDLQAEKVSAEIPLQPVMNCTGDVWHVHLPEVDEGLLYAFRVQAPHMPEKGQWCDPEALVLDPYGITSVSRGEYGKPGKDDDTWPQMASAVPLRDEFDWEGDRRLQHRPQDHIVYELHVRGFTQDPSSKVESPGTFAGMREKLQHIADMGFTAVELMPVQEFNELEYYSPNPVTGEYRYNYWGYSTINFFSPASRYSAGGAADGGRAAITEFKELVKECHRNGLEVILDIVFNHTAEGNELGPVLSFRGLDNRVYYVVAPAGQFYNYSGCGNTFNCNHPVARRFIVDCLRYWVTEMHVDGFR